MVVQVDVSSGGISLLFGIEWSWLVAWSSDISGGYFPSDISGRVSDILHLNDSRGPLSHLNMSLLLTTGYNLWASVVFNSQLDDGGKY